MNYAAADLHLAIAHHLLIFLLAGILAFEIGVIRPGDRRDRLVAGNLRRKGLGLLLHQRVLLGEDGGIRRGGATVDCPHGADHKLAADAGEECCIRSGRRRHSEGQALSVGRGGVLRSYSGVCRSDGARLRLIRSLRVWRRILWQNRPLRSYGWSPSVHLGFTAETCGVRGMPHPLDRMPERGAALSEQC